MKILIISDAWHPQINGVVRTLTETVKQLRTFGHEVKLISPNAFKTIPCPSYPDIPLAIFPYRKLARLIADFQPAAIHIATEGTLGLAARRWCLRHKKPFTTAYHTQFPEYIHARCRLPLSWLYAAIRWFHKPSQTVMTPTPTIKEQLLSRGFQRVALWSRGVDLTRFTAAIEKTSDTRNALDAWCTDEEKQQPKFVCIGRVAVEKNIEAFLKLDLPGSKWVIGDGPAREKLEKQYPDVHFLGAYPQKELPPFYRAADVFVFPSRTDTFGLVLLEAMACGTPVAAFPVTGPIDVVGSAAAGILHEDLRTACLEALDCNRQAVREYAEQYSWENASRQFEALLVPFDNITHSDNYQGEHP